MTVTHSRGTYSIAFGSPEALWSRVPGDALVITDENVAACCPGPGSRPTVVVPAGEKTKSIEFYEGCLRELARRGLTRRASLVAFGGGVIGDLVGFVAATYMRGVSFVQIPTTLLAQVDSSVGGKVGIDLPEGKNLVGAFKTPSEVLVATEYLESLDDRELRNGMAEVWKYGYILDADLVADLESHAPVSMDSGREFVDALVRRCIALKAKVVEEDEFETTGLRAILNFGHTVGHAIEKVENYLGNKHGEAIAIGMVVESKLGERLGTSPSGSADRVRAGLASQGLPTSLPSGLRADDLVEAMRIDKKAGPDGLAFSLLTGIGACKLVKNVPELVVREVLDSCWA